MVMESQEKSKARDAGWPLSEMLWRGTFGTGTRAERRVIRSSSLLLIVLLGWGLIAAIVHLDPQPTRVITLFKCLSLVSYYAFEKRRYFLTLDELSRRIEMEGMAWAYGIGVLAAMWLGGIAYAISPRLLLDPRWSVGGAFFLVAIILASVKGTYRYFATRRY